MSDLRTGWARTRRIKAGEAGIRGAVPYGPLHAVDDGNRAATLCGAEVRALGPPWPRGLGPRCHRCQQLAAIAEAG